MGLFSKLFKKEKKKTRWAQMLNGYMPVFSQFGENIYASDVVQQCIYCIVTEMKKLNPHHIRTMGNDIVPVSGDIQRVLNKPNNLMTTSDFIEKIVWLLYFNFNAFIIPSWEVNDRTGARTLKALTPVQPSNVEFLEDLSGELLIKMHFRNQYETTLRYRDIIHIRHHYSVNEFMGGNEFGMPDNEALLKTLRLNEHLLKSVDNGVKSSCAVNGVVKFNSMLDKGKTDRALKELEEHLNNSESGFLPLDLTAEFIPIKKNIALVDDTTLKFIDEKILRHFGVPLCILTGDYTKVQYAAFYQKTLEPLIIAISQAFTRALFTDNELAYKNEIKFFPKELVFMSVDQTLQMVNMLSNTGGLYENEKRVAFGLAPLPELAGKRYMSLNWVDVDIAQQYQLEGAQAQKDNRLKKTDGDGYGSNNSDNA